MHPKPSVQIGKHQSKHARSNIEESPEERAERKAEAAMEAEIKGAAKRQRHPPKDEKHHGVVFSMIAKHKVVVHKREQERAALRKSQGVEGDPSSTSLTDSSDNLLHSTDLVDALEVVDTEIQTISTLSNITRSIIVPTRFAGKPPVVQLTPISSSSTESITIPTTPAGEIGRTDEEKKMDAKLANEKTNGEIVDKHVKAQLKRQHMYQKFISVMKGTWVFVKTPLGILAAIYGFLVIFSGAALVICLAGWVPGNKDLQVEIFSQSTNALFTITGVGLIPWRLRDTYIISRICHYRNRSNDLRKKRGLPPLQNANDLAFEAGLISAPITAAAAAAKKPDDSPGIMEKQQRLDDGAESSSSKADYILQKDSIPMDPVSSEHEHMLSSNEAAALRSLQQQMARNCTWYRPNETPTHYAYPIGRAVTVTAFIDLNSFFQCLMCGFMWGYATHYHDRPAWATGTFMPLSFVCGIVAGIVIWIGGKKTHKKEQVKERLKAAFEEESGEA